MEKRNTKSEILNIARQLFNECGYNNVTMRDIASAVGISVGNLTYHFKRKDLLIEACIVERRQTYKIPLTPTSLELLNKTFIYMAQYNVENSYYFSHYTQLAQICPRVYQIQINTTRDHVHVFCNAFKDFQKKKLMKPTIFDGQLLNLSYTLMNITTNWIPQSKIMLDTTFSDPVKEILSCLWSTLAPMLTEKGLQIFETKIEPSFTNK